MFTNRKHQRVVEAVEFQEQNEDENIQCDDDNQACGQRGEHGLQCACAYAYGKNADHQG